jgi:ESS family glutamate:Na+ symporter
MTLVDGQIQMPSFLTVTLGILVLLIGKSLNKSVRCLREFTIPEAVSGGLFAALVFTLLHLALGIKMNFGMQARDLLLVYFFTTVGMKASFADLRRGGRSLVVVLMLTILLMLAQNLLGVGLAQLSGLPAAVGLLAGTVSLVGGHGTTIAWAPQFARAHGVSQALEIGLASATFGLILASASGGPIARFLIRRFRLKPSAPALTVSPKQNPDQRPIHPDDVLAALLAIHICIILGSILQKLLAQRGVFLPLFVPCLIVGILLSNLLPKPATKGAIHWPSQTPALNLIAELSLGTFLAMSLMTLEIWTLVDLAGPLLAILMAQFLLALMITILLVFPLLGGTYDAAVIAAGFSGYTLGSTATAMANMTAVTDRFGPSPKAFIVLPLVSAFFIDLLNAVLIPMVLRRI